MLESSLEKVLRLGENVLKVFRETDAFPLQPFNDLALRRLTRHFL